MLFILARSANKVLIASADTICVQMNLFAESVVQSCAGSGGATRGLSACVEPLIAGNDEPTAARRRRAATAARVAPTTKSPRAIRSGYVCARFHEFKINYALRIP